MNNDRTRTILVVDDMRMFRDLGALFLARTGRVLTASSAVRTVMFPLPASPWSLASPIAWAALTIMMRIT